MNFDANAFIIVRNVLLSHGYVSDAVSSRFIKATGGRSTHTVFLMREYDEEPGAIVPRLYAFAEANRSVEYYNAVSFIFLDFDGRYRKDSDFYTGLNEAFRQIAYNGIVCDFLVMDMTAGTYYGIGSGSGVNPALHKDLTNAAISYAGRERTAPVTGYADGIDPELAAGQSCGDEPLYTDTVKSRAGFRDYGPSSMIPVYVIIGLCVAAFIWGIYTEYTKGYNVPKTLGIQSTELINKGQWWRLFTPMFLHADIGHLAGNMLSLLYLGRVVTRNHSKTEFLTVYFVSGLAGNVLSYFFLPKNVLSLGASGAVLGLGGMLIYMFTLSRNKSYFKRSGNYVSLIVMVLFNLLYGVFMAGGNINNFAHFGGFAAGFLVALVFETVQKARD